MVFFVGMFFFVSFFVWGFAGVGEVVRFVGLVFRVGLVRS